MALDERDHRLFVVTRLPARLVVLDTEQGKRVATLPTIGDCDDVFYDERLHRIYAIGGEGGISVFQQRDADHYDELGRIKTVSGARTGFFSAELDKLYVAVRKHESADCGDSRVRANTVSASYRSASLLERPVHSYCHPPSQLRVPACCDEGWPQLSGCERFHQTNRLWGTLSHCQAAAGRCLYSDLPLCNILP